MQASGGYFSYGVMLEFGEGFTEEGLPELNSEGQEEFSQTKR